MTSIEFKDIREYASTVATKLINRISPDPCFNPRMMTKKMIKLLFYDEFCRAMLELEAEKKELCLCTGHWKAEVMLGQALLRRNSVTEGNVAKSVLSVPSTSASVKAPPPPQQQQQPTVPPNVWDTVPMKASKQALESSPGPKSPSVTHAQKHTKDNTLLLGQNTLLSLVHLCESSIPQF
jgi:hypothetical protein